MAAKKPPKLPRGVSGHPIGRRGGGGGKKKGCWLTSALILTVALAVAGSAGYGVWHLFT